MSGNNQNPTEVKTITGDTKVLVDKDWYETAETEIVRVKNQNQVLMQKLEAIEANARTGGPKPNKPNAFNGTVKERVDIWCFEMDQYFKATGLPDSRKVAFASSFLHQAAATWWRAHCIMAATSTGVNQITTWKEFTEQIVAQFKPINSSKLARERLFTLRQTNSVMSYVYQFNLLCLDIPGITDEEKLDKFKRGLKPSIQLEVETRDPPTFTEATLLAQRIDSTQYRVKLQTGGGFKNNNRRDVSDPMEIDNVEMDEDVDEESEVGSESDNSSDDGSGEDRSASVNAVLKKRKPSRRGKMLSSSEKARCIKNRLCFRCKKPNHMSRNCPSLKKQGKGQGQ